jgi:hypothetical protein
MTTFSGLSTLEGETTMLPRNFGHQSLSEAAPQIKKNENLIRTSAKA